MVVNSVDVGGGGLGGVGWDLECGGEECET